MFKDIEKLVKAGLLIIALLIALLLILLPRACRAQDGLLKPAPNFYAELQATRTAYKLKSDSLLTCRVVLKETRKAGDSLIAELDRKLIKAVGTGNTRIKSLNTANQQLATKNETLAANLDETRSQLETAKSELKKWKPKTKAGLFFRKVRNGLAVVGGLSLVGIAIIAR